MTVLNLTEVVNNYNRALRELKTAMGERFKAELKTAFKAVFAEYPNVTRLEWTQYTPYFNDGDICVFSVNEVEIWDDTVGKDDEVGVYVCWGEGRQRYPMIADLADNLSRADTLLLEMFGDHCRITVTPEGIDVEEYEHD